MPGEDALERLQIIIEADASGVAPAANQAASAVENMGRRTTTATRAATEAVKRYKEAFREAAKVEGFTTRISSMGAAIEKTNQEYAKATAEFKRYSAEWADAKKWRGEGSDKAVAANAKAEAAAMRMAALETKGQAQAEQLASLEAQRATQARIAAAAATRAEQAQAQANAAAQGDQAQSTREAANATRDLNQQMQSARKGKSIFSSIGSALRSMLIIRSVTRLARHLIRWLGQAAMANREFNAAVSSIKGNLIAAFAPIYDAIIPWLTQLANAIATVVGWIASLSNWLFGGGTSHSATEKMLSGIGSSAGGASKQMKQLLANFDELNVLERDSGSSGGGGGGGSGSGGSGGTGGSSGGNVITNMAKQAASEAAEQFTGAGAVESAAKIAAGAGIWSLIKAVPGLISGTGGGLISLLGSVLGRTSKLALVLEMAFSTVENFRGEKMTEVYGNIQNAFASGNVGEWLKESAKYAWGGVMGSAAQGLMNAMGFVSEKLAGVNPFKGHTGAEMVLDPLGWYKQGLEQSPDKWAKQQASDIEELQKRWNAWKQSAGETLNTWKEGIAGALEYGWQHRAELAQAGVDALAGALEAADAGLTSATEFFTHNIESAKKAGTTFATWAQGWLADRLGVSAPASTATTSRGPNNDLGARMTLWEREIIRGNKTGFLLPGERTERSFEKAFELWDKGAGEAQELGASVKEAAEKAAAGIKSAQQQATGSFEIMGRAWDEMSLADKVTALGIAGAGAFLNITSGLLGTQTATQEATAATENATTATDALEDAWNRVTEAVNKAKEGIRSAWEEAEHNIGKQEPESETVETNKLNPSFYMDTKGKVDKVALNAYDRGNDKYDVSGSTLPSHGSVNGPATYQGTQATAQDVAAAVTSALKGVKIELDGRALGQVVQGAINTAVRGAGRSDLVTLY